MNKVKVSACLCIAAILLLSGCYSKETVQKKYNIAAKELVSPVTEISTASNKLGFKYLQETSKEKVNKNIAISPFSLSAILALTQNGADNNTKDDMLKTLYLKGMEDKVINDSYKNIIAYYNGQKDVKLSTANSMWLQKDSRVSIREDFKELGRSYYEAEQQEVDLNKKSTVNLINKWVSDNTEGKIKEFVKEFNENTIMVLINTLYFKGDWQETFMKQSTSKENFMQSDNSVKQVDTMHCWRTLSYLKDEKFEAVRLPYKDENFGMYILLPNKEISADKLISSLDFDKWNAKINKFAEREVILSLPKFSIEFEQELNEMFIGMGMETAFDPIKADFTKLADIKSKEDNVYISLVKQKCTVDINENGTEAAAATEVVLDRAGSAPPKDQVNFKVDRPFVFFIADKHTGMILFMGKIENP